MHHVNYSKTAVNQKKFNNCTIRYELYITRIRRSKTCPAIYVHGTFENHHKLINCLVKEYHDLVLAYAVLLYIVNKYPLLVLCHASLLLWSCDQRLTFAANFLLLFGLGWMSREAGHHQVNQIHHLWPQNNTFKDLLYLICTGCKRVR